MVLVLTACSSSLQDSAVRTTNGLGLALEAADAVFAPVWAKALADANAAFPDDDGRFHQAVATQMQIYEALGIARDAQRWLHLAVQQWVAGDEGAMWKEVAPCAVAELRQAEPLFTAEQQAAFAVLIADLDAVAPGVCVSHP